MGTTIDPRVVVSPALQQMTPTPGVGTGQAPRAKAAALVSSESRAIAHTASNRSSESQSLPTDDQVSSSRAPRDIADSGHGSQQENGRSPDKRVEVALTSQLGPPQPAGIITDRSDIPAASPKPSAMPGEESTSKASPQSAPSSVATETSNVPSTTSGMVQVGNILRLGPSEIHMGVQTSSFGNVEVHAVLRESQVGLAIGSEHGELRSLLATEVPHLAGRLEQHDLQLHSVHFFEPSFSSHSGSSSGQDRRSGQFQPPRSSNLRTGEQTELPDRTTDAVSQSQRSGLSIHV